ncbi:MAG TPA: DUF1801 domain-containing protein [Bacillota bacterium]
MGSVFTSIDEYGLHGKRKERVFIGFYPGASAVEAFQNELSQHKHAKGSVQFSISEPLPMELIQRIVKFRVEENRSKK